MPNELTTGDDREILEQAGAFHFVLSLVPQDWFRLQSDPGKYAESFDQERRRVWWIGYEPKISIFEYCDDFLIRGDTSTFSYGLIETVWVDEDHHRVELWEVEPNSIADIDVRIDARYPFSTFLSRIVEFIEQMECVVYLEYERDFIKPTAIAVYGALRRSHAARLAERQLS